MIGTITLVFVLISVTNAAGGPAASQDGHSHGNGDNPVRCLCHGQQSTIPANESWESQTIAALTNNNLEMRISEFIEQRIRVLDFPALTDDELSSMKFTIGDRHAFRRIFGKQLDIQANAQQMIANIAGMGDIPGMGNIGDVAQLIERLSGGDIVGLMNPQNMVMHKFSDMDGIFGGVLGDAMSMVKSKIESPGEYSLRKAILSKLFRLGKLKLPMLKETEFEKHLTGDVINEWEQDPVVQKILEQIDFLGRTELDKVIPRGPPKVQDNPNGCCGGNGK
eukprot:74223_1